MAGRIDPDGDRDVFKLDLSSTPTHNDIWIYATSDLDTFGELLARTGEVIVSNETSHVAGRYSAFHIRRNLSPGVYYVRVRGSSVYIPTGSYTLHAEVVTDPGSSTGTATSLNLDSPTPGTIDTADDADYFRLEFTEATNLIIHATSLVLFDGHGERLPLARLGVEALDSSGTDMPLNLDFTDIGFRMEDGFGPGTSYLKVFTPDQVTSHPVHYTIHALEDTGYTDFIKKCEGATRPSEIDDALYRCQWHLNNRDGEDINVEAVWAEGIKGEGVNVVVVDDGMHYAHEDLRENVDASRNHDYNGNGDIYHPGAHHGTRVAGIIAARDNGIGIRGVAPRATIYGYNSRVYNTSVTRADAMARNSDVTAVSNNSWSLGDGPGLRHVESSWELAVNAGITTGYGGKGTFYAFAAGNGHRAGDDSNLSELSNYYVDDNDTRSYYSEMGANLWVCAPSSGGSRGMITTENSDRYDGDFGGTSAATPVVAGVAALLRDANPDLTWRDLKLILAASARRNDGGNPGWRIGARKYGAKSETDRYHFNHEYGFGVVDAKAAVDLAKEWSSLPPMRSHTVQSSGTSVSIPDAPAAGNPTTVAEGLTVDAAVGFVEFVEVAVSFQHDSFRDLQIELVAPSGSISQLAAPFSTHSKTLVPLHGSFRFGSALHLGEDPNGKWQLRVTDRIPSLGGTLDSWSLTVYGHGRTPGPPSVDLVTAAVESLTVAWSAPNQTWSPAVTAYDLRHIQTADDETIDSNWTVVENVWTSTGGGDLEHDITGLTGGIQYDVQVRSVNAAGDGPWSEKVTGTAAQAPTSACTTGGAVANAAGNPGLVSDCSTLLAARDALAGAGSLNWESIIPIAQWDGVTVRGTPRRVTRLILPKRGLSGRIPAGLGSLSMLTKLNLRTNELSGTIPAELGDLSNLVRLNLHTNKLTGSIPDLSGTTTLQELYLSNNDLDGPVPSWLGTMTSVRELWLWGNELSGAIPDLSGMTGLDRLKLQSNKLTGGIPLWLGRMTDLRYLYIHLNPLNGEISPELGGMSNLDSLVKSHGRGNWKREIIGAGKVEERTLRSRWSMFQAREPQESLWQSEFLITPRKAKLMRRSWAEVFRNEALVLIEEERFAPMYSPDMGRPNRAVQTVLGVLVLKEMFDLTDMEALEELEFNLLWHHALRLEMEEARLAQKTLHNFRVRLMEHDGGRLAFSETTDRMIEALGLRTGKQRLDSTHVMSNIAVLTRLGLFCETVRVFLLAVSREHPGLGEGIGDGLAQRYLKESGEASRYEDARSGEGHRRLSVCARDVYRLVDRFRGTAVAKMEEDGLLERLLGEQCHVGRHRDGRPGADDDDAEEGKVPIALKEAKEVRSSSMQTPHDPEVTYSGHKGKGYEVQVSETCEEGNAVQVITHVEVTPSSGSDAGVTVGVIDTLRERGIGPSALWCDTSYGSGHNGWEAERRGTELVSPVGGRAPGEADEDDGLVRLTAADFDIDVTAKRAAVCPAGHEAVSEYEDEEAPERVEMHFAREVCEPCSLRPRCPVRWRRRPEFGGEWSPSGAYVLSADLARVNIGRRRRAESDGQWRRRYGLRAGIEGTNSELKRRHGLGRLRVRGGERVRLAVYLKALACNVKRMVRARLDEMLVRPAALATAPTDA